MKWHENMYVGDSLAGKEKKIQRKIEKGKFLPYAYVITLAANPKNLLDIVPAKTFASDRYPKAELVIVGIAADRAEAEGLMVRMIEDTLKSTGNVNVWDYFGEPRRNGS